VAASPIHVQVHPGERGRRRGVVLNAGCCCCCCCCCLHTIGGVLGAMLGSAPAPGGSLPQHWVPPSPGSDVLEEFDPSRRPSAGSADSIDRIGPPTSEEIVQALTTPSSPPPEDEYPLPNYRPPIGPAPPMKGLSGVALYWIVLVILTPIASVALAFAESKPRDGEEILAWFLGVLFLGLPAVQLAASVVASILILFWPPEERPRRLQQIGRITLWSVCGTGIGLGVMALFCIPCMLSK
jgi:hypothetical protein